MSLVKRTDSDYQALKQGYNTAINTLRQIKSDASTGNADVQDSLKKLATILEQLAQGLKRRLV